MAANKSNKSKFGSKSAFVRALDPKMPAAEVVAMAAKKGIELTPSLVYNIRSTSKTSSRVLKKGKPGPKPGARKGRGRTGAASAGSAEIQLRSAIAALGITKTREILAAVEAVFAGG